MICLTCIIIDRKRCKYYWRRVWFSHTPCKTEYLIQRSVHTFFISSPINFKIKLLYFVLFFLSIFSFDRAIFTWVSKVIRVCIVFVLLRFMIGLKPSLHFLSHSEVKPKPIMTRSRTFPALRVGYMYLLQALIDLLDVCVLCDWLECLLWFWFYRDTQLKTALK